MSKLGAAKVRINLSKIDKSVIYQGEKGKYIDIVVNIDPEPDSYDQHGMVTQDIGQERRQAGEKGPILGNVQRWWPEQQQQQPPPSQDTAPAPEDDDDIPF